MTIVQCWMKAQCLPDGMTTALNATFGRMPNTSKSSEVKELVELLSKLRIGVEKGDPLHRAIDKDISEEEMERWVEIKADEQVTSA